MHNILIVSEDPFMRDLVRLSLADMGAEVRCADDTGRMRAMCRRVLFDVVIVLGVGSFLGGDDLVRAVRKEGLRRPALYVLSWQQSEQTVLSLLECGVDQYMTLPVSLQRLRTKIANELNRQL